jgi:hypothetical protein
MHLPCYRLAFSVMGKDWEDEGRLFHIHCGHVNDRFVGYIKWQEEGIV